MSEDPPLYSFFDKHIADVEKFLHESQTLADTPGAKTPWDDRAEFEEMMQRQRLDLHQLRVGRDSDAKNQARKVCDHYSDPVYNAAYWRRVAEFSPYTKGVDITVMCLTHKGGGQLKVAPRELTFDYHAAATPSLLEESIVHVKTVWSAASIEVSGNNDFRKFVWALAQIHGVMVANFQLKNQPALPRGEILKRAKGIVRQSLERPDIIDVIKNPPPDCRIKRAEPVARQGASDMPPQRCAMGILDGGARRPAQKSSSSPKLRVV